MSYPLRKFLATVIVLGMIFMAGYINITRNTNNDLGNISADFITRILYNHWARNILHIIAFSMVGFLIGPWANQLGSRRLAYLYAIIGGVGIETIQILTTREKLTWRNPFYSLGDLGFNMTGVTLGLLILYQFHKRYPNSKI